VTQLLILLECCPDFNANDQLFQFSNAIKWLKGEHEVTLALDMPMLHTQSQLLRATEMMTLLHGNADVLRSIFLEDKLLITYLPNSKSRNPFSNLISRTIAKPVSDRVIDGITLIRSIANIISADQGLSSPQRVLCRERSFVTTGRNQSIIRAIYFLLNAPNLIVE